MLTHLRVDQRGFLLVEAVIAMSLMAIAFALFAEFAQMMTNRNSTLTKQAYLSSQARAAMDMLTDDIEGAACNGTTQPVTNATPTSITFTSPDRLTPYHLRQITYTLSNGVLTRQQALSTNTSASLNSTQPPFTMGSTGSSTTVVDSLQNTVLFHFYSASYNPANPSASDLGTPGTNSTTLAKIARISMTLTTLPVGSHNTGSLTTQGQATLMTMLTAATNSSGVPQCPS